MSQKKVITPQISEEIKQIFTQTKIRLEVKNKFGIFPHESPLEQKTHEMDIFAHHSTTIISELMDLIVLPKFPRLDWVKQKIERIKKGSVDPFVNKEFLGASFISFLLCVFIYSYSTQDFSILEEKKNFGLNSDNLKLFKTITTEEFEISHVDSFTVFLQEYLLANWKELTNLSDYCQMILQNLDIAKEKIYPNIPDLIELAKIITAFANNEGGKVYIGINNSQPGITEDQVEEITQKLILMIPKFSARLVYYFKYHSFNTSNSVLELEITKFPGIIAYEDIVYTFDTQFRIQKMSPDEIGTNLTRRKKDIYETMIESLAINYPDMKFSLKNKLIENIGLIRDLEPVYFHNFLRILSYMGNFMYLDFDDRKYLQESAEKFYEKHRKDNQIRMEVNWFKPAIRKILNQEFGNDIVLEGENARGNTDIIVLGIPIELKVLKDEKNPKSNSKVTQKRGIEVLEKFINQSMVELGKSRCGFLIGYDFRNLNIPDEFRTDSPVERIKFHTLNGKLLCLILLLGNMKSPSDLK